MKLLTIIEPNFAVINLKFAHFCLQYTVENSPNYADGMAYSANPDQTAPLGESWSGSTMYDQAFLSETSKITVYLPCRLSELRDVLMDVRGKQETEQNERRNLEKAMQAK